MPARVWSAGLGLRVGHGLHEPTARGVDVLDAPALLAAVLQANHDAIVVTDLVGTIRLWSPGAERLYGHAAADVIGHSAHLLIPADRVGELRELIDPVRDGGPAEGPRTIQLHRAGRRIHVSLVVHPVCDASGRPIGVCSIGRDVTAATAAEHQRRQAQQNVDTQQEILEQIARGDDLHHVLERLCREVEARYVGGRCMVLVVDPVERTLRHAASPSLPEAVSNAIDDLPIAIGMGACGTAAARCEEVVITDALTDPTMGAFVDLVREHHLRAVFANPLLDQSGEVLGTFSVYCDAPREPTPGDRQLVQGASRLAGLAIERRRYEEALTHAALVDPLTRLPNRTQFLDWVARGLTDAPASMAVLFLDLDQFKSVNDTLGHPAGDRVLREAARRLRAVLREDDVLSRFGGDEFTVLVRDADERGLEAVAARIQATFDAPFLLDGREFFLSASIGIALGRTGAAPFDLIRDADVAMYDAKAQGPGMCAVFDEALRHRALERVTLGAELRRAIERRELVVHYQPIFNLETGECRGAEALLRWQHPTRGLVPPGDFIPLAEETRLIIPLGALLVDEVLGQLQRWAASGIEVPVTVNLSPVELSNPGLVAGIAEALTRHAVGPGRLFLEITETAVMEQIDTARCALEALTELGVGVLIDDFGTGYSSISRLSDLPVVGLKVDRHFVSALGTDASTTKVTMAIIDLANALDLQVIAEGIETQGALEALVALECSYGQGFHLGRPGGPETIAALF